MKKMFFIGFLLFCFSVDAQSIKTPVDYVNPYIGNISHLLAPTYPTIHLPNSMLRVYPERTDFTSDQIKGLPMMLSSHRGRLLFNLIPFQGDEKDIKPVMSFSYDNEIIKPYFYSVVLDEQHTFVKYSPSHQSAVYELNFNQKKPTYLLINAYNGELKIEGNSVSGYQLIKNNTKAYIYIETSKPPIKITKEGSVAKLFFGDNAQKIHLRYGVSYISEAQAKINLAREIKTYDVDQVSIAGKKCWNQALGKIQATDKNEKNLIVFYTALYRFYERQVSISEDGNYYSAFDGKVHKDDGRTFYTDDWIWDTYRAAHPLRILLDPSMEVNIIRSFIRMSAQMPKLWMPTFPEVSGDSRRMNSNHAVATVADAYAKGLRDFDLKIAYLACKQGIEEKTLAPWSGKPAGWLDSFYKVNGYMPALLEGEQETVAEVNRGEKRQPIAVTLGTSYDHWCLSQLAKNLGDSSAYQLYLKKSYNYRNVFNPSTRFFHPKDKNGNFIMPFDYRFSGGQGAREAYGENNGWVYRWDVQHNIADLIALMGGNKQFIASLDSLFQEPMGKGKFSFYSVLPDHTGNVGQYSMANEPSLHIPYLYNFAGEPWKTQKRIRSLLNTWFRNDYMGMPGDEDGGGMSAFVVFSSLGFYPVTPGIPAYSIGSPLFSNAKIKLENNKVFEVEAINCSAQNKYIQSAVLNGKKWDQTWFFHDEIKNGGKLILVMGSTPNYQWGVSPIDKKLSADSLKN